MSGRAASLYKKYFISPAAIKRKEEEKTANEEKSLCNKIVDNAYDDLAKAFQSGSLKTATSIAKSDALQSVLACARSILKEDDVILADTFTHEKLLVNDEWSVYQSPFITRETSRYEDFHVYPVSYEKK